MRDSKYLEKRLNIIWDTYFPECRRENEVIINFGKEAKKRLGSIRKVIYPDGTFDTLITINGYFKNDLIPDFIIDATIAHEICHYAHGISSPLPRLSRYPHRGGVIDTEMNKRGLASLREKEEEWLNQYWAKHLKKLSGSEI